jgi:antitoxin PrlF
MRQTVLVSNRGQLTLPSDLRKRFGIDKGGVVVLEERDNELVLKPAVVLEIEMYSDRQIAEWDAEDRLDPADRVAVGRRLAGTIRKK